MATNTKSEPPRTDDLTTIVGINETLEQWFRETLKVQTYADLAALSVQKIRSRAKQAGFVLANEELELMLAQAKKLAEASPSSSPENSQPAMTKSEAALALPQKTKEWNEFATFVVCFERKIAGGKEEKRTKIEHRTGIEHHETGEKNSWPGIETDEACRWMLQRLGNELGAITEKTPDIETPEAGLPPTAKLSAAASLEITQIQLFHPPSNDHPQELLTQNRTFNGFIKSETLSSLMVTFKLTGDAIGLAKRKAGYSVAFAAHNLFTSAVIQLGTSEPDFLREGQLTYTAWLAPFAIPSGAYSLKIVATIRDAQPIWAFIEIPLFQVA